MATNEPLGRQLRKSTLLNRSQELRPPSALSNKDKSQRNERSRRSIFKKKPVKGPHLGASTVSSRALVFRGRSIVVGDIVAIESGKGETVYAQISGLLTDPYGEKSASLIWLAPSQSSGSKFDPQTYVYGLSDDIPRKLDGMKFVMHLPIDHFKSGAVSV